MSSTYSDNLKIELIGTGDQAGNWGSTTNTNLGTLIEQAISGYIAYPCSGGAETLSMTQGASATPRNMYIKLTGTGGGTLTVPSTPKLYFIWNSTSLAITFQSGSGVSVPAGAKVCLMSIGSSVIFAENYLYSAVLDGVPTAPTAAVGTNTTQVATTQFVQQAGLTGEVKLWATASAPTGYLFCNGASVSTTTYASLFAVIGYTYGGSGASFLLPNFAGRMPIGVNGTYTLASTGGVASVTLAETNLPSHTHSFSATSGGTSTSLSHQHDILGTSNHYVADGGQGSGGTGTFPFSLGGTSYGSSYIGASGSLDHTHSVSGTTGGTGSGTAVTTISPYLGVYYIIKT
jgi:microcystin-dependent protein